MRLISVLLCCAAGIFSLSAVENGLAFKVRIPVSEQKDSPVIRKESDGIRTEKRLPGKKLPPINPESLAGRIGDSGSDIIWIPAAENTGSGKMRLKSVSLSHDASVLFCVEEIGDPDKGPFGAYLIIISPEGRRILRYHEFSRKITGICADLSGVSAVAYAEAQPELKQEAGFLFFNLKTGKTIRFFPYSKPVGTYLLRNGILFAASAEGTLDRIDLKTGDMQSVACEKDAKILALTGDSKHLASASASFIRFYRPGDLKKVSEIPLSGDTVPYRLIPGDPKGSFMFLSTEPGFGKSKIYLIYNRELKLASDDSSGEIVYEPKGAMLFTGRFLKNRIYKLDPTSFAELAYCNPKNLKPITEGSNRFLFRGPGEGEFVVVDSRCNVFLVKNIRRRWNKFIIVSSGGKK